METADDGRPLPIDDITGVIINEALHIHRHFGPGMLESVYEVILMQRLTDFGLRVSRQHSVSFEYGGTIFTDACTIDLLVEDSVIVEVKSVQQQLPVHAKQLLTYLRLMERQVGLLINFGSATLKEGVKRVVNHFGDWPHTQYDINRLHRSTHMTSALETRRAPLATASSGAMDRIALDCAETMNPSAPPGMQSNPAYPQG